MGTSKPLFSLFITSVILFSGCFGIKTVPEKTVDSPAWRLSLKARNFNRGITSAKGTATLTLEHNSKKETYRIAWAVSYPDMMRMTLLSMGHPVETILADGTRVTFLSHAGKHAPYTLKRANPSLADIIQLPVTTREIIGVLAGRIPIREFDSAMVDENESTQGTALVLGRSWRGDVGRILMDSQDRPIRYQPVDFQNKSVYTLVIKTFQKHGAFDIPMKIEIRDTKGRRALLEITKFIHNIPLKRDIFSLTEPG